MAGQKISIKLKGFDCRMVDQSTFELVDTAKRSGSQICGPIPMPTRIEKFSVNRSPHVNKKAMDQFELRTHSRLVIIIDPTPQTVDDLKRLNLPAGIEIAIHL